MATLTVPYNTAMQLGSGFNSYTQTLCIDHAVVRDSELAIEVKPNIDSEKHVAQSVIYKTSVIDKTTDVTDNLNVSGAFSIKYDQLKVEGNAKFVDTDKIKNSDVSIMISVKVVNQSIYDHQLLKFQPVSGIKDLTAQRLIEVYGDSFISGWQEGGDFLAIISIKAKNREDAQTIVGDARMAFTRNKDLPENADKKDIKVDLDLRINKLKKNITAENEVSVSVTWTGGAEKDWDFDTMKDVALRFPDLCAKTPMRTHALITKYTALRSFYTAQTFDLPLYDKTGAYTGILQEAYLDYKAILGSIQILAFDFAEGTKALVANPRSAKAITSANQTEKESTSQEVPPATEVASEDGSIVDLNATVAAQGKPGNVPKVITVPPPTIGEPFLPTIEGLEEARLKCRFMMSRIIQEIDNITIKPEIAVDESRLLPYLSPFLFKMLLPIGVPLPAQANQADQAVVASNADPDKLANKYMGAVA
ncbi:hypothetical protein AG0111_0g8574 [Alternaria gaisen]|uniref:Uncharacterized protein n=1 Tax=Alternaria gaisen TaxID=167740 RepID=A0ACB6FG23_9PLEO|nr:hypothetical protein AG0111_0g8574 [Alternaria gaisen]